MSEWPKTAGEVWDDIEYARDTIGEDTPLIPAELGRELHEALNRVNNEIRDDEPDMWDQVENALARYDREVRA